jgi:Concanavalin A-like lectin/glucanases superfamily/Immunoglobulin domain
MKTRINCIYALLMGLAIFCPQAKAQFIRIDDFANATNGNLNLQVSDGPSNAVWHAVSSASVVTISQSTTPGVGLPGSGTPLNTNAATTTDVGDGAAYIALPMPIPTNSTVATFFMQFDMGPSQSQNNVNWDFAPSVGSDGGGGLNDIELNANVSGPGAGRLGVTIRNGGAFVEMSADGQNVFVPTNSTVYNIWFVVDNAAKNFVIYMQDANPNGTDLPNLTRMTIGNAGANGTGTSQTAFLTNAIAFRNNAAAPISYFVFGTGGGSGFTTTQYVYSVYEDANFMDLTNPVTGAPPVLLSPPIITGQPQPEQIFAGGAAVFTVNATGGALHYQWQSNGVSLADGGSISGSSTSALSISNVSAADATVYSCVITNANPGAYRSTNTAAASLTLVSPNGSFETSLAAAGPIHFYAFDDTGNPATGSEVTFDYAGGDNGIYGANSQNGFNGVAGPQPTNGFPGFTSTNAAAQFASFGEPSHVSLNTPWNLNTNNVTVTAWINPAVPQNNLAGIAFNRGSGNDVEGLNISASGGSTLGYTWNNDPGTYDWDSGLQPPVSQWSFVALVVTPTNATIYMMNAAGLFSSTHVFSHLPAAFGGTTMIGDDSGTTTGARTFFGSIDEVAVFNQALSAVQLQSLYASASGASSFAPSNTVTLVTPTPIYPGQTAQFSSIDEGTAPLSYTWQLSGINLTDGPNAVGVISGSATPFLTISNLAPGDAGQSYNVTLVTRNGSGVYTSTTPAVLSVSVPNPGQVITTLGMEAPGSDWDTATNWNDNNPASLSAYAEPNSTYQILPGTLERTPASTNAVFPGSVLVLEGNGVLIDGGGATFPTNTTTGELRLKQSGLTAVTNFGLAFADGGTIFFPDLQLNGGQIDNGTSSKVALNGRIDVLTNSSIYADSAAAGSIRTIQINSFLTGSGLLTYGYLSSNSSNNDLIISGTSNTFSGQWHVRQGTLLGNAPNSLGTNTITVDANAALETTYNINNPHGNLNLNGQMFLYTSNTFNGVTINGVNLTAGTYSFAQLRAAYPANFPISWPVQVGSTTGTNTGAGSITVLTTLAPQFTQQPTPASLSLYPGQTAQFAASVLGALGYQWWFTNLSNVGTKLNDGGSISGSRSNVLTITGVTSGQAGTYTLVASNASGATTSSNAVLTILTPSPATNITMSVIETSGQDWNTGANWSDGNPASLSAYSEPGSTYEVLTGAELLTPDTASNNAFPGNQLTIDNGATLVLEHIGARNIAFPDLRLNGALLNNGADGLATLTGQLEVSNSVTIYTDTNSPPGLVVNFDVPGGVGGINYNATGAFPDVAGHTYWNPIAQVMGTGTTTPPSTNSDGVTTSGVTLTVNTAAYAEGGQYGLYGAYDNSAGSTANTPVALEANYLFINNTFTPAFAVNTIQNTLNNVPPGNYNLYLYGNDGGHASGYQGLGSQNDWGTTFTVSSDVTAPVTLNTSNETATYTSDTFIPGADYVVFSNVVVGAGGTITFTWTPNTNVFSPDYTGANSQAAFNGVQLVAVVPPAPGPRPFQVASLLSGNGTITYNAGDTNLESDLSISGAGNTFSGQWNVIQGTLLGSVPGSLGTNSIAVAAKGALETVYAVNNPAASLVLNGQMFLHENDTFGAATVVGRQLSPGTYTFAQLSSTFPSNFPASWPLQVGSAVNTGSGGITVLTGPPPSRPAKITAFSIVGGNLVISGTNGAALGTYRVLSSTNAAQSLSTWTVVTNASFDGGGSFNVMIPFNPQDPRRFYSIASP